MSSPGLAMTYGRSQARRIATITGCCRHDCSKASFASSRSFGAKAKPPTTSRDDEMSPQIWLVSFMKYDLGFFDHQAGTVTSAENPFGAKVLPMSSV